MENQNNPQDPKQELNPETPQSESTPGPDGGTFSQQGQPSGPPPFGQQGQPSGPPPFGQPGQGQYDYQQSYQQQSQQGYQQGYQQQSQQGYPQGQGYQQGYQQPQAGPLTNDDKLWGMLAHLLSLLALTCIPLMNIAGPLIVWIMKKDTSAYVERHGRESLNFQISCFIYGVVGSIICFILSFVLIGILLAIVFYPALLIFWLVVVIMASIKAYDGKEYQYPLCIRFF